MERSLCLIAVFSPPFPSVLTGRGGYNLEVQLRWNSGGIDPRSPSLGSEPAEVAALQSPGELAEEQRLLPELHLALDRALRRPLVLVEHWAAGESFSSMGKASGYPRPNPVEFPFFIISQFLCH